MDSPHNLPFSSPYMFNEQKVTEGMNSVAAPVLCRECPSAYTAGGMLAAPGPSMPVYPGPELQMAAPTPVWSAWPPQGNEAPAQFLSPSSIPLAMEPPKEGKRRRQRSKNPNSFYQKYKRLMEVTNGTSEYWSLGDNSYSASPPNPPNPNSFHKKYKRMMEVTNGTAEYWSLDNYPPCVNPENCNGSSTRCGIKRKRGSEAGDQTKAKKSSRIELQGCVVVPPHEEENWSLEDFLNDVFQPEGTALPAVTDWSPDLEGWDMGPYQEPNSCWETSGHNQAAQTASVWDVQNFSQFAGHVPFPQVEERKDFSLEPLIQVEQETLVNALDPEEYILEKILEDLFQNCH